MRFIKVLLIMMFSGLLLGMLLAVIYGPSLVADIKQQLLDSWAGNFFELAFAESSTGNFYTVTISDSIEIKDKIDGPCEESGPLCDYEKYMSTEHEVNIADALETRNSFAGKIGE